jgi:hypothetical protein
MCSIGSVQNLLPLDSELGVEAGMHGGRRHQPEIAMMVMVVVPVEEGRSPLARLVKALKAVRIVLQRKVDHGEGRCDVK